MSSKDVGLQAQLTPLSSSLEGVGDFVNDSAMEGCGCSDMASDSVKRCGCDSNISTPVISESTKVCKMSLCQCLCVNHLENRSPSNDQLWSVT